MNKIKTFFRKGIEWFREQIAKVFSSRKKTLQFIAVFVFTILFLIEVSMILINNSFYNNASDDILQYYTIIVDFISGLKEGTISWFNLNNYFGASLFSDVYYIPIDLFTGTTFIFSYLMPIEVAYSITELIKILVGVMLFAYYLSLKGMKNRTIFWMSMIYFISGGTVSFMAFPVFLSLTAYMPLALIVIHYFFHKKRWIVPLFSMAVIFYDFYLGYTLLAFISFAYLIEYFKEPGFHFVRFVKESVIFLILLLLGVVMAGIIAYPSIIYILEETYRGTSNFNAWIINIFGYDLKLFQPNIYIRFIAKIFTEQKPIGFYGFENSYATEHVSLYISIIGFVYMNYIFFMKDKISRLYKIAIGISIIFMILPLFSYVFSGTMDSPYTRWINMLPIFQVMILAHVFDRFGFEEISMKKMTFIISFLLLIVGGLIYYYISQLKLDDYLASRDVLTADTVLIGVAGLYLILLLIFGWLKKWTVIKWVFWIEFFVAIGYIYSGPFTIKNKITTFENAHEINAFLDSTIKDDTEFYRVYVDIDNLDVEDTNFNRMTGYATNTGIFHSWTDAETNEISYLLFNSREYQSKNKMNTFGYYLSHFLSYKYVLVDADSDYAFDEDHFELYTETENYKLYKLIDASPFKVYDTYMTYTDFIQYNWRNSDMATEKILLMAVLIDSERYVVDSYDLELLSPADESNDDIINSYKSIFYGNNVVTAGMADETERLFYQYTNDDLDITFGLGAAYIRTVSLDTDSLGEAFMEFSDGSRKACWIQPGESHQIKCEFFQTPTSIYIEDTESMNSSPTIQVRLERAINAAAYLVYDLTKIDLESDSGIINFSLNTSFNFGRTFVVDENGEEHECLEGFYSFNAKPVKLYAFKTSDMYGYSNLFNLSIRFSYDDLQGTDSLLNQETSSYKHLTIERGKIELSYIPSGDSTQIVVIPVAYSDDWKITSPNQYETLSVSGGFLGIVIPPRPTVAAGTEFFVDITLKFVPKGLNLGALATLGGTLVYLGIFLPGWIKKRKNGDESQ
ncbi:MAG: hypothetical protein JXL85_03595 [Bacilli bacterium]|nr:hypothetical protein [Bacilli bacterium]